MKKFLSLLVLVLAVAFTSQASNGAGIDNIDVGFDVGYDLPSATAIVDNTFAQTNSVSNSTVITVNYTSEGGFEVASIVSDGVVQNYNDIKSNTNTEFAVITNKNSSLYEQIGNKDSNIERETDKTTSPNSTKSGKRIATNVGKYSNSSRIS